MLTGMGIGLGINLTQFVISGEEIMGNAKFINHGSYSFVVPDGVTTIACVCVGAGGTRGFIAGTSSSVSRGATVLCLGVGGNSGDTAIRDGGGDSNTGSAAGYSGDANSGTGGSAAAKTFAAGGGVELWGEGQSGTPGTAEGGSGGSDGATAAKDTHTGGDFGGSAYSATPGGGLSYVNDIVVTPGETLDIIVGLGGWSSGQTERGGSGGVNIVWGRGSFPNLNGVTVTAGKIEIVNPS